MLNNYVSSEPKNIGRHRGHRQDLPVTRIQLAVFSARVVPNGRTRLEGGLCTRGCMNQTISPRFLGDH
jgi:hypothetical protein